MKLNEIFRRTCFFKDNWPFARHIKAVLLILWPQSCFWNFWYIEMYSFCFIIGTLFYYWYCTPGLLLLEVFYENFSFFLLQQSIFLLTLAPCFLLWSTTGISKKFNTGASFFLSNHRKIFRGYMQPKCFCWVKIYQIEYSFYMFGGGIWMLCSFYNLYNRTF